MTKQLGTAQASMMDSLRERGCWYPGCGWSWDGTSATIRVMEGLVRRGLVTKTILPATKSLTERPCYRLAK